MAESFVFDIANSLLGKLASYACEEASRAYGVYDDLQGLKDTLSIVSGVLLDAEEKKTRQHALREWLRQIQNICFDAEDVLDGFELQDKKREIMKASSSTRVKVGNFFSISNPLAFRIKMAHQINKIKDRLDKVAADATKFRLVSVDSRPDEQRREMTYPDVDTSSVVGRENEINEIINLLMQPHPKGDGDGDKSICVIPIVGIGGLGKTTLAKSVFNDKRVDDKLFPLKMWVCVSDDFDIRKIIIQIINSATVSFLTSSSTPSSCLAHQENINNLHIVQLVARVRQKLSGQKFLVVLDDVWNDDRAKWLELKDLIKVGAPGSKIMVTTRSNLIASMMGDVSSYDLEGLSPKDCLSLFVKWAFKEGEEKKYPNLVEIGKEIVKKCQGVPLAVRTLGSSLFSNFDVSKWVFVRDSELWNLEQKKDDILPALKLSYDQMPLYLRQCFAYFSLYPKDHIFSSYVMCSLWVALGLVQSLNGSEKLESIARKYIDELHSRSFIQDVNEYGSFCDFKVHDLIHDLALYVTREDFVAVDSHTHNIPQQVRHLSVLEKEALGRASFPKSRRVRSILFPIFGLGLKNESVMDIWTLYISDCGSLNLLLINESPVETLRLKHLHLRGFTMLETLPGWIECAMETLETLEISIFSDLKMLPAFLTTMTRLKRLYIIYCPQLSNLTSDMHRLTALEDLRIKGCPELCRKCQPQSDDEAVQKAYMQLEGSQERAKQ
ncbi:hypothetical protein TSUD_392420 [Trifolium subterraneum]|uniref:NB-ARC domain-containing protein n=1 Tax=Trifolium subterraneum TaxID=3900 RepID=A0A2Z6MBQ5_TRISU|nr:hypothetical protein TSUD_392420 [Trifolium subterraneum]